MSAAEIGEEKRKPTVKEQKPQTYVQVERGIYRYKDKTGEITYHERPEIAGKRTYRALGFGFTRQTNLANARTEFARRRTEVASGRNPYEEKKDTKTPAPEATVSDVIRAYVDANYPDRYLKPRTGRTLEAEVANCETLLEHWDGQIWNSLTPKSWDDYHAERIKTVKKGCSGNSSVDKERITLSNAFKYAMRKELVTANPAAAFSRFHPLTEVKHCREFQPHNAEELHEIAALFFESSKPYTWSLGFQLLFEANTGLRTEEVLMLRTDAKPGQPGYIAPDGNMHIARVKRGCNPFVHIHPGLKKLLKAHVVWKAVCYPDSPWFFPGKLKGQPVQNGALAQALRKLKKKIGKKITSHGMRAFYVLIRRSQNISDDQIALELGQRSGGALIATVYGDVPENWRNGGGPNLTWAPKTPAWTAPQKRGWRGE